MTISLTAASKQLTTAANGNSPFRHMTSPALSSRISCVKECLVIDVCGHE
ncbi:hypothetical protein FOCC_FOCC016056 [Frankliniella occidentalis]|nr:hypothetical protein FOCC_FOCC016056 [Frankliniella occidentalis]